MKLVWSRIDATMTCLTLGCVMKRIKIMNWISNLLRFYDPDVFALWMEWTLALSWVHHSPYICDVNKFVLQLALELNKWFVLVIAKLDGIQMPPPIVETLYFEKNSSFISSTHELDHKANEFVIFYRQSYNHLFFDYVWSKVLMNYHFISWVYIEKVNMSI